MTHVRIAGALLAVSLLPWTGAAQGPGGQGFPAGLAGRARGMGGPMQPERKLVAQFDKDGDKRLNAAERTRRARGSNRSRWDPGGPAVGAGGRAGRAACGSEHPARASTPADVKPVAAEAALRPDVVRTLFLEFENDDWEEELMAFNNTDVEVPATLTVDGKTYKDVGVHFRGASSFFGVPDGLKHSLNVSLDFVHDTQNAARLPTLNLLNSHDDPTFLRTVLYLAGGARDTSRRRRPTTSRVVINGESWGVYVSAQQFNKEFMNEWFKTTDGARWKVPGSPQRPRRPRVPRRRHRAVQARLRDQVEGRRRSRGRR